MTTETMVRVKELAEAYVVVTANIDALREAHLREAALTRARQADVPVKFIIAAVGEAAWPSEVYRRITVPYDEMIEMLRRQQARILAELATLGFAGGTEGGR